MKFGEVRQQPENVLWMGNQNREFEAIPQGLAMHFNDQNYATR